MPSPVALLRFQIISAYLAHDPPRGQRRAVLEALSAKSWSLPDGRQLRFAPETLRRWVRRYRDGGLAALEDNPRTLRGVQVLTEAQRQALCQLKRDVPERSLDRLLHIAQQTGLIEPGSISRSTLHRLLKDQGLSRRPRSASSDKDLDRFEAVLPNDLWQSDMMAGPWLPDPDRPGKQRRAWLTAWLDDHSRLLVYGRFAFKQNLPTLELSFRQALRRCGIPRRAYYDNGAVYRSRHMQQVCAELGIHRVVFTTPYRPEGHGKIEAFNRHCRAAFVAEVKASNITTLDELNLAFAAWAEHYYNRKVHSEISTTPRERWQAGLKHVRHVDEATLRRAFQWTESRTTDKTGVFSLFGQRYQASADLARRKLQLRFDPEALEEVEVWLDDRFVERVRGLEIGPHRRPAGDQPTDDETPTAPVVDWLGHLVEQNQGTWRDPEAELRRLLADQQRDQEAILALFEDRLVPEVFDRKAVADWLHRFGPLQFERIEELLDFAIAHMGPDHHIDAYLDGLRAALLEGEA